jgi:hypothetical protein
MILDGFLQPQDVNKMSNQKNIEKLSKLREQALELIKQYNIIAEKENYETRIGIIDANVNVDSIKEHMADEKDIDIDELPENLVIDIKKYLENSYDERPIWYDTDFPGTDGFWEPSGINC